MKKATVQCKLCRDNVEFADENNLDESILSHLLSLHMELVMAMAKGITKLDTNDET